MRRLRNPVRCECEEQSADERRRDAASELARKQKHAKPRQDERRQEQEVVAKDGIARQRIDRKDLERLRNEMLRVRERQRGRVKDVRIEEMPQVRVVTSDDAAELLTVPREDPHVEDRIAKIPRDVTRESAGERPGQYECGDGIATGRIRGLPPAASRGPSHSAAASVTIS